MDIFNYEIKNLEDYHKILGLAHYQLSWAMFHKDKKEILKLENFIKILDK